MVTPTTPEFSARCVVDASVLIKVVIAEPHSDLAKLLMASAPLDARVAPDLAYLECASILATGVRRGIVTPSEARSSLMALYRVPLTVHPATPLLGIALDLALSLRLSAYDGVYLALADALGVPLVTADAVLARAVGDPGRVRLLAAYATPEP